jgi:hypothetical protein
VNNLSKFLKTMPGDYAPTAQALHFLRQSEQSVWNWVFQLNGSARFGLFKHKTVVTVSRAFGLEPLPNHSLHGSGPRFILLDNTLLSAP